MNRRIGESDQAQGGAVLQLRSLNRVSDADGRRLLHDVSLDLRPQDFVVVQGSSGSGKTLLLRALALLDPCEGQLLWHGRPVAPRDVPAYRAQVQYVAQSIQLDGDSVEDALRQPFSWHVHRQRSYCQQTTGQLCEQLELEKTLLRQPIEQLSGGQRQRVGLIRSLLLSPSVLLLDEPTAGLDDRATQQTERVVKDWLRADSQRAVVWISHDSVQRERLSHLVWHIDAGRVVTSEEGEAGDNHE